MRPSLRAYLDPGGPDRPLVDANGNVLTLPYELPPCGATATP